MLRDIFTNKWIIGGILLLIIIAGGCYFWYQHSLADDRKAAADGAEYARRLENQKAKQKAATETETTSTQAPAENNTAEKPVNKVTAEVENNTESGGTTAAQTPAATAEVVDVPVSPHGFGPYPEVPSDFPENVDWDDYANDLPIYELMTRVQIKLWNQGQRAVGIFKENGLLYPTIKGSIYIRWGDNGKDIVDFAGHPDDISDEVEDQLWEGIIPSGFKILNYDESGIDPYEFLNLR
ncbi:MAG: hypothetical protein OXM61_03035 [Candidatus Poribacteria bacterium]|nr:hypothetical protein [Candidatus Poribacteria bacterium]